MKKKTAIPNGPNTTSGPITKPGTRNNDTQEIPNSGDIFFWSRLHTNKICLPKSVLALNWEKINVARIPPTHPKKQSKMDNFILLITFTSGIYLWRPASTNGPSQRIVIVSRDCLPWCRHTHDRVLFGKIKWPAPKPSAKTKTC